ncbi:hypothetical protein ThrDRAFT_02151 [Frankia casuarinae]|nr:hypothetical protein CcI6DRAFT_00044 [Frankia sp. CcI6]EYT92193.1 hypothetical protein ThrDRAFT_02151 [Frankia casuarinae]KDA45052.1 hypothetical protein BMG523Draft_00181 [Frankia sp. BMG5.23]KFB06677.1 hypothetical protein ALLO2DRAFT_00724 [Frankia sp. Allo2]
MWEAKAAPGRASGLRDWAIDALAGRDGEVYVSSQRGEDLVVIMLRTPPDAGMSVQTTGDTRCPLPKPPAELANGDPHTWQFEQVHPPH